MTHIWRTCPLITPFCNKILHLCYDLIGDKIVRSPLITLLSMMPGSYKQNLKSLLQHFLTSACTVIARASQKPQPLSFVDWACEMDSIGHLERLISWKTDKTVDYTLTWYVWNHFQYSSKFASYLWSPWHNICYLSWIPGFVFLHSAWVTPFFSPHPLFSPPFSF